VSWLLNVIFLAHFSGSFFWGLPINRRHGVTKDAPATQSDPAAPQGDALSPEAGTVADASSYRIFVRDLVLTGLIGIHAHEQDQPQRIQFNVDLLSDDGCSTANDDIANVVSYEDIVSGIKALLARGHVGLVETLAEEIAAMCLGDGRVRVVRVRVEKLDVFEEAASVGVEIERRHK
jgi:dihydroneopterin aldolase